MLFSFLVKSTVRDLFFNVVGECEGWTVLESVGQIMAAQATNLPHDTNLVPTQIAPEPVG